MSTVQGGQYRNLGCVQGVQHKDLGGVLYRVASTITYRVCTGCLAQGSGVIQGGKHKNLECRVSSTRLWGPGCLEHKDLGYRVSRTRTWDLGCTEFPAQ
jgi:hypothetical protein